MPRRGRFDEVSAFIVLTFIGILGFALMAVWLLTH